MRPGRRHEVAAPGPRRRRATSMLCPRGGSARGSGAARPRATRICQAHQVETGDPLGHGVLDLEPGVHLQEVEVAVPVDQELHRARADVAHRLGGAHGHLAHRGAHLGGEDGRGRLLDDLLVAALRRALALVQMDECARLIARTPGSPRGAACPGTSRGRRRRFRRR